MCRSGEKSWEPGYDHDTVPTKSREACYIGCKNFYKFIQHVKGCCRVNYYHVGGQRKIIIANGEKLKASSPFHAKNVMYFIFI